jgi:hypothetical protein
MTVTVPMLTCGSMACRNGASMRNDGMDEGWGWLERTLRSLSSIARPRHVRKYVYTSIQKVLKKHVIRLGISWRLWKRKMNLIRVAESFSCCGYLKTIYVYVHTPTKLSPKALFECNQGRPGYHASIGCCKINTPRCVLHVTSDFVDKSAIHATVSAIRRTCRMKT